MSYTKLVYPTHANVPMDIYELITNVLSHAVVTFVALTNIVILYPPNAFARISIGCCVDAVIPHVPSRTARQTLIVMHSHYNAIANRDIKWFMENAI